VKNTSISQILKEIFAHAAIAYYQKLFFQKLIAIQRPKRICFTLFFSSKQRATKRAQKKRKTRHISPCVQVLIVFA
jgi:hypothetical protein